MPGQRRDRWVWDLYPLSPYSWGNQQYSDDGTLPGQTVTIQRDRPRRRFATDWSVTTIGTIRELRKYYVPTDDDLRIVRERFRGQDPQQPSWHRIKAALVVAGRPASTLNRSEAPVLLALLVHTEASLRQTPTLLVEDMIYLSPGTCIERLPLAGLTDRQKRHQLDRIRTRCAWLRTNDRGHIHADDWRLIVTMLRKHSIRKSNVSDAVSALPPNPSPEEIATMKESIRSSNLATKRSRK